MKIIKISPFCEPKIVRAVASVYQQAFGGEPWNEGYICPMCQKVFARNCSKNKICPSCVEQSQSILMVEYWPISKVVSDFYNEMKKSDSICVIAKIMSRVIGFAWGYLVSAEPGLDIHLDAPGVCQLLQGDFFYLDECAILPSYQGKGIGKMLVSRIFSEQQQKQILLRTMNDSRMCNLIKHKGGEIIQHILRGRIIMRLIIP